MDTVSKERRSEIMSKIRSMRTKPEMKVHGMLKGHKVRHRMWPSMFGKPDVLIGSGTVLFINGCYFHGCEAHFVLPKTNKRFWAGKIARNIKRQRSVIRRLKADGYVVKIIWEHQLKAGLGRKLWARLKLS